MSSSIALWTSGGASRVVIPYDKGRPAATHTSNPSFLWPRSDKRGMLDLNALKSGDRSFFD